MSSFARLLPALLATLILGAASASAEGLLVGGYADRVPAAAGLPGEGRDLAVAADAGQGGEVVLDFTPRGGGLFEPEAGSGAPRMRLELSLAGEPADWPDALEAGAAATPSWLADPETRLGDLSIGGALRWSEWSVGGGYAHTGLMGGEADLLSATLGYGSFSARLGYGEADGIEAGPLDVLLLSTDLAAASWLTLESDVALGSSPDEEQSVAVGRLGVRLNF